MRHYVRALCPTPSARALGRAAAAVRRTHAGVAQVAARDGRELRDGDLRLLDLGVPALLPLEAEQAAVAAAGARLDLPAHGHVAGAGEHVPSVLPRRHRVLEVRVADPRAELAHRLLRLLLARHEGVVRVPEQ